MEGQKKKIAELEEKLAKMPAQKPHENNSSNTTKKKKEAPFNCYRCGEYGHAVRDCKQPDPRQPNGQQQQNGIAQNGSSSQGFVPQGFVPQGFVPQSFVPPGFVPNGFVPQQQFPPAFVPQGQPPNPPARNAASPSTPAPQQTNNGHPIREKHVKTCIKVQYEGQQIIALVDTGSDVSIAGEDVARKYGWVVHDHPTKNVKIANDEEMIIDEPQKFFYRLENEVFILRFLLLRI